jgi:hypothetical protein
VAGTIPGGATTDFGAPEATGPWDDDPLRPAEAGRLVGLLESSWQYFDAVAASAPERLRKGPRGGGRDTSAIIDHVREAERAYSGKFGDRVPPRTPWAEQRTVIAAALRAVPAGTSWPAGYSIRRLAWHVLDHAWEIEDKSE